LVAAVSTFYLGTHRPHWLRCIGVPLFVSRRTLAPYKTLPRAAAPWALDSGAFSELAMYGKYHTTPAQYVSEARRFSDEVGQLQWAAPQDWMCEPFMLAKTGLTVAEHQARTIDSVVTLRGLDASLPFVPVVQGYSEDDYLRHVDQYARRGIDLAAEMVVGLGSVCRRHSTDEIFRIVRRLHGEGLRLHGFGMKTSGFRRCARYLASADSMAWSFSARREPPLVGCTHRSCTNCASYALRWRASLLTGLGDVGEQLSLGETA
jgi:hypothetical protein